MLHSIQYRSPRGDYQIKSMYFSLTVLQFKYMRKQKTHNYYLNTKTQKCSVFPHFLIPSRYSSVLQTGCQSVFYHLLYSYNLLWQLQM